MTRPWSTPCSPSGSPNIMSARPVTRPSPTRSGSCGPSSPCGGTRRCANTPNGWPACPRAWSPTNSVPGARNSSTFVCPSPSPMTPRSANSSAMPRTPRPARACPGTPASRRSSRSPGPSSSPASPRPSPGCPSHQDISSISTAPHWPRIRGSTASARAGLLPWDADLDWPPTDACHGATTDITNDERATLREAQASLDRIANAEDARLETDAFSRAAGLRRRHAETLVGDPVLTLHPRPS